jgi:hypothetical protein
MDNVFQQHYNAITHAMIIIQENVDILAKEKIILITVI